MIRKGRPVSHAAGDAGGSRVPHGRRDAGGADHDDAFDPFESFDAHDEAEGRGPSGQRATNAGTSNDSSSSPAETIYTRSRRVPGESPDRKDKADKSQRPVRSLKGRALGYLSRREYSRAELSRKLMPFVEEVDALESLLDSLEKEGWLSDSRFAESLIHRRASRLGANRIVGELKRHAVGQTLIEEASAQLRETELARAQAVWRKKYGELPETPAEKARQARFLAARGFSGATIGKILKGFDDED
ncbi:recombination regulator RecX [Paraburkholderia sp. DHOC27]|uniref:recombination regulator RecX n=1 Tax=Paraburkholderia sp. DHOC27 TaxID=2303330 RepID=UPI000E3D40BF|nr:recombination regulator RecX [Paraburkholderia sp. DHOC27]RFU46932.1 recombination regulator RecX [Paraburkholderia sp. DHOC27]